MDPKQQYNNNKKTRPKAERQSAAVMRSTLREYMQTTPSIRATATTTALVVSIIFSTIPHLRQYYVANATIV